jgi:hypothetical protein
LPGQTYAATEAETVRLVQHSSYFLARTFSTCGHACVYVAAQQMSPVSKLNLGEESFWLQGKETLHVLHLCGPTMAVRCSKAHFIISSRSDTSGACELTCSR